MELRAELSKRGLSQTGKRDELIERLEEYEFQHAKLSEMDVDPAEQPSMHDATTTTAEVPTMTLATNGCNSKQELSPILPPTAEDKLDHVVDTHVVDVDLEEEKRRARAIRFGLNPEEVAKVDITITVKRLDHALPNRRQKPTWRPRKHAHRVIKH